MKRLFDRYFRKNIIIILILSIILYSIYYSNIVTIYAVDPYKYIKQAKEFSLFPLSTDIIQRGIPFILYLKAFLDILGNFMDTVSIIKISMLILVVCFYFYYYKMVKELFNEKIAFVSCFLLFFEISFNTYAIMPYFELFALLFGFGAIFFIKKFIKTHRYIFLIISLILSIISSFSRMEMFIIIVFPIMVSVLPIFFKNNLKSFFYFISGFIILIIIIYPFLHVYYFSMTRFNPVERIFMGLRWDIISNALNCIFSFTENIIFNTFLMWAFFLGLILYIVSLKSDFIDFFQKKSLSFTKSIIPIIMIIGTFSISIFIYGYSYQISGTIISIFPIQIALRFLILTRVLVIPIYILFLEKLILFILSYLIKIHHKIRTERFFRDLKKSWKRSFIICTFLFISSPYLEYGMNTLLLSDYIPMNSEYMSTYQRTANWLANNTNENESMIVPFSFIFEYHIEDYRENLISYEMIWDAINIYPLKLDLTYEEKIEARDYLINLIESDKFIRYIVIDWIDPYIKNIYEVDDGTLFVNLTLVHEEMVLIGNYRPSIKIYTPFS